MQEFDIALLGPLSLDINVEPDGTEVRELGGAITYSPYAAAVAGVRTVALAKANLQQLDVPGHYRHFSGAVIPIDSAQTTSIRNVYYDVSHERRDSTVIAQADGFSKEDLTDISAKMYHLGGLIYGDFSTDFIKWLASRGEVGVDAQCLLRHADLRTGEMPFIDYADKMEALPYMRYFKVDAREAEIMTGTTNREQAAAMLYQWGAQEVFISYHTEMMAFDGKYVYTCAYKPVSTEGRTGRGDTVFASYLAMRLNHNIEESLLFATALVSLKIAKIGPFLGTTEDIKALIARDGMKVEKKRLALK